MNVDWFKVPKPERTLLKLAGRALFNNVGMSRMMDRESGADRARGEISETGDLFDRFLTACGYDGDEDGFLEAVLTEIRLRNRPISVNRVPVPVWYLYRLLEILIPGERLHTIQSVDQLEQKAFVRPDPSERADLQEVLDRFPVRLSDHVIRQSLVSEGVARQYLPFAGELDPVGRPITFDGHLKKGVLEQMYPNRVVLLLDMTCPVYCRFCFRKHKSTRKEKAPSKAEVLAAVDHVRAHPAIHEILITGGEPLLNRPRLDEALQALMTVDHVKVIRIATRSAAYYPDLFLKKDGAYLRYLIETNARCRAGSCRLEIGVHFVHPDEVSVQSLEIMTQLVQSGIQVYVQTPFLNGLNTDGDTLGRLFALLRRAGVKIYYVFTPCSPIHGTRAYWTPISRALEAQRYLRTHFSDRCMPKFCTATPLGKMEWHTSGWAVEKDPVDDEFIWIRTPYTLPYFMDFVSDIRQMPDMRVNKEGTLDARFQAAAGDSALFLGGRPERRGQAKTSGTRMPGATYEAVQVFLQSDRNLSPSIAPVPSAMVSRVHRTRVQMNLEAGPAELTYVARNPDITDGVLIWDDLRDPLLQRTDRLVARLKTVSHIDAVRICWKGFVARPEAMTPELADKLASWNDFSLARPFRIEVETWWVLPEEITEAHADVASRLVERGVNVYANAPLIQGLNDQPQIMTALAHRLRQAGIEFHHLYVSGLDIQDRLNGRSFPGPHTVIDIASEVRRRCSGREIPLYIRQTPLGEMDFGLDEISKAFL